LKPTGFRVRSTIIYGYPNFEGNAQALDHIYVSSALLAASPEVDLVHVNTELAEDAMRGSDHDPVISRFVLAP